VRENGANCPRAQTAETARAVREKARTAQERELPKTANCRKAQTAQGREVPNGDNGADIGTARTARRRQLPKGATT
jgi:hypothetical protein